MKLRDLKDKNLQKQTKHLYAIHGRLNRIQRQLSQERRRVDAGQSTRDIINDYNTFSSRVYAPLTRTGVFPDRKFIDQSSAMWAPPQDLDRKVRVV